VARVQQAAQLQKVFIYPFLWGTKQPGKYKTGREEKGLDNRAVFCCVTFWMAVNLE